jgi:hypothetical protein
MPRQMHPEGSLRVVTKRMILVTVEREFTALPKCAQNFKISGEYITPDFALKMEIATAPRVIRWESSPSTTQHTIFHAILGARIGAL